MITAEKSVFFLSWQSSISGPYSVGEIRDLLRLGRINSLYKIEVDGHWQVLRDYLAELERKGKIQVPKVIVEPVAPVGTPEQNQVFQKTPGHPSQENVGHQKTGQSVQQGSRNPQGRGIRSRGNLPLQSSIREGPTGGGC